MTDQQNHFIIKCLLARGWKFRAGTRVIVNFHTPTQARLTEFVRDSGVDVEAYSSSKRLAKAHKAHHLPLTSCTNLGHYVLAYCDLLPEVEHAAKLGFETAIFTGLANLGRLKKLSCFSEAQLMPDEQVLLLGSRGAERTSLPLRWSWLRELRRLEK